MSLLLWAQAVLKAKAAPAPSGIAIMRTLDRSWGNTPGSGGGNVEPDRFMYGGANWELWQVVPFLGTSVSPPGVGDCRVHLRNRDKSRGQNLLTDMPVRVVLSGADWVQLPWEFTRPSAANKFTNVGSGNSARKGIDYEPTRSVLANPSISGIAQGETFTITLHFE